MAKRVMIGMTPCECLWLYKRAYKKALKEKALCEAPLTNPTLYIDIFYRNFNFIGFFH